MYRCNEIFLYMKNSINLYEVETAKCGTFYAVAESFDKAKELVESALDKADYGFYSYRMVTDIHLLRERKFMSNGDDKPFLSGGNNINMFVIQEDKINQESFNEGWRTATDKVLKKVKDGLKEWDEDGHNVDTYFDLDYFIEEIREEMEREVKE